MIENHTPYAADRNWTRDKAGVHVWLVAVQATFDIARNGLLKLADDQPPPLLEPIYRGEPGASSLHRDSELLAPKQTTDIVLDARAHAPARRPAPLVLAALRVGSEVDKTLVVHGPRAYYKGPFGLEPTNAEPFVSQPIVYESAFGGADLAHRDPARQRIDLRNPVGKGLALDPDMLDQQPAHTIEFPEGNPATRGPAGFGPVASFWSPRRELAGTYDDVWVKKKKPLLPDDYDERFAQSAPIDQRTRRALRGGEPVLLQNMTTDGVSSFELPKIYLTFRTRVAGRNEEHRARLVTVFIAPDERRLQLVWHSTLRVRSNETEHLESTIVGEKSYV